MIGFFHLFQFFFATESFVCYWCKFLCLLLQSFEKRVLEIVKVTVTISGDRENRCQRGLFFVP